MEADHKWPDHPLRISVVMPVYNEMATIEEILVRVQATDLESSPKGNNFSSRR